jgi:ribosome biogenesis protein ENP2
MDVRLYKKAKSVANPFEFEEYRKKKIRETIEKDRGNRVQVHKLPKVNKDLALKLMNDQTKDKKKKESAGSLLQDSRFARLFENPDFEVDKNADEYRLLNPVLSRLDQNKKKELKKKLLAQEFEPVEEELEGKNSSDESSDEYEESSDDDHTWTKDVKKQYKIIQREHREKERLEEKEEEGAGKQPKLFELRQGEEYKGIHSLKKKINKAPLGERVESESTSVRLLGSVGHREMTFSTHKKRNKSSDMKNRKHREERKQLVRPVNGIRSKHKPSYFRNKKK